MKSYGFRGDYGIGNILFILLIMIFIGAERIQHIDYLKDDPLFRRIVRLTRIPHRTKISTALKQFSSDSLKALAELNSELVVEKLNELGLNEITIDLDGTVISTKGKPSWALKGYNPIKKGARSYFPLTAHVGETGHFLAILNRPGNVHDSKRALFVYSNLPGRAYALDGFQAVKGSYNARNGADIEIRDLGSGADTDAVGMVADDLEDTECAFDRLNCHQ